MSDVNAIGAKPPAGVCPFTGPSSGTAEAPVVLHAPDGLAGSVASVSSKAAPAVHAGATATTQTSAGSKTFEPGTAPKAVLDKIPCPFLRASVNEGKFPINPDTGEVDGQQLFQAIHEMQLSGTIDNVLVHGGEHTQQEKGQPLPDKINLYKLKDGALMHTGDSKIIRNGFNQDRLDDVLGPLPDKVTLKDLAHAQEGFVTADPGLRGHFIGAAEMSLLISVFGRQDPNVGLHLNKDDLRRIYQDARFPEGWQPHPVAMTDLLKNAATLGWDQLTG